jgi:hypothetical protein
MPRVRRALDNLFETTVRHQHSQWIFPLWAFTVAIWRRKRRQQQLRGTHAPARESIPCQASASLNDVLRMALEHMQALNRCTAHAWRYAYAWHYEMHGGCMASSDVWQMHGVKQMHGVMSNSACGRTISVLTRFVINRHLFSSTPPPRPYMRTLGTQPSTTGRRRPRQLTRGTISGTLLTLLFFTQTVSQAQRFDEGSHLHSFCVDAPLLYLDANSKVWRTFFSLSCFRL